MQLPEGVPDFPDKNKFVKEINELIQYFAEKRAAKSSHHSSWSALVNAQFVRSIRELFLHKFVQMFASYEKFVIAPPAIQQKKKPSPSSSNSTQRLIASAASGRSRKSIDTHDKENSTNTSSRQGGVGKCEEDDDEEEEYRIESYWLSKVTHFCV